MEQGTIQAELEDLDGLRARLRAGGAAREIPNGDIVCVRWPGRTLERRAASAVVELWNGDVLRGMFEEGRGDRFQLKLGTGSKLEIRIDSLRRLVFPKQAGSEDLSLFTAAEGKDRLYRRVGSSSLDFLGGTLEAFEGAKLSFRAAAGKGELVQFSLDDLAALVLTPIEAPKEEKDLLALVDLVDGTRVTGRPLCLGAGRLELEGPNLGRLAIELKDVLTIRFKNGRYVYLSDLDPVRVEESSPFGGGDGILFPVRKDRSVGGRPLRCGGNEFLRGLGVHSKSLLVFRLDKRFRLFRTSVGIDDEVLELSARGSVVFRIYADDKSVYESPVVRGGAGPLRVPDIPLQGVAELGLEVDYAEDLHVADRADWLEPMLIQ